MSRVLARSGSGRFSTTVGSSLLDRAIGRAVGIDRTGTLPVSIRCRPLPGRHGRTVERWTRQFGARRRTATVSIGAAAMSERLGPLRLHFALATDAGCVTGEMVGVGLFPLPAGWRLPTARILRVSFAVEDRAAAGALDVGVTLARPSGRVAVRYEGTIR